MPIKFKKKKKKKKKINTLKKSVEIQEDWRHLPMRVTIGNFLNHGNLIFPRFPKLLAEFIQ